MALNSEVKTTSKRSLIRIYIALKVQGGFLHLFPLKIISWKFFASKQSATHLSLDSQPHIC